jgi:catechol 2,3-dioxygenase-like lactoylglutathione lyase family enzyme
VTDEPVDIAIPLLPSLDLRESLAFYNEIGFPTVAVYHPDYAIVCREAMEIHFWACDDRRICESSGCYVRVSDVRALFTAVAPRVSPPGRVSESPEDRPWGMREFYVWDPHGNLLRFGQDIGED